MAQQSELVGMSNRIRAASSDAERARLMEEYQGMIEGSSLDLMGNLFVDGQFATRPTEAGQRARYDHIQEIMASPGWRLPEQEASEGGETTRSSFLQPWDWAIMLMGGTALVALIATLMWGA